MKRFHSAARQHAPSTIERTTPADRPWLRIQTLPALALGVGFVVLLGCLLISWAADVNARWALAATGASMILVVAWGLLKQPLFSILHATEQEWQTDINADGHIGKPPIAKTQIFMPLTNGGMDVYNLPIEQKLLVDWCKAALNDRSLAINLWSPRFSVGSDLSYQDFLARLDENGVVVNVGGSVGHRLKRSSPDALRFVRFFIQAEHHFHEVPPVNTSHQIQPPPGWSQ